MRAVWTAIVAAPALAAAAWGADLGAGPAPPLAAICHFAGVSPPEEAPPAPAEGLLSGYGRETLKVATASAETQAYFDNGLQLGHAFAHRDAVAAFRKAERLDPRCAMCVFGEAWARGPTLNFSVPRTVSTELKALADHAAVLAETGPPLERELIRALQDRYADGGGPRGDQAFAEDLDRLARADPRNDELAVLAADARMIPAAHADSRTGLGRARELLLGVLARDPANVGAIHFYIHATEMDGVGVLALPYAEALGRLAPAASHLTHMPSHTFLWAGRFRLAEEANLRASALDDADARRTGSPGGPFTLFYHAHNVQFGLVSALLANDAAGGLALAEATLARAAAAPPSDPYGQEVVGSAYAAVGRLGGPARAAALPEPPKGLLAATFRAYAQGEASAGAGDAAGVRKALALASALPADLRSPGSGYPGRSGPSVRAVILAVLRGREAMLEGRFSDAAAAYAEGAKAQESGLKDSRDPPVWWYPVRRSLAAALLAEGRPEDAVREVRLALQAWPYDPASLEILARAGGGGEPPDRLRREAASNWTGNLSRLPLALM